MNDRRSVPVHLRGDLIAGVLILLLCLPAYAQELRGELLYTTHCHTCHSAEIHWREQRLVTDWGSLLIQVQRWQSISDLHWSADEISDVAHYLNRLHYRFPESAHKGYSRRGLQVSPQVD